MRIGVDVGGTNTDAVLMDGREVRAWTKQPTTHPIEDGIHAALTAVLGDGVSVDALDSVMIGTTHFTNAFVEVCGLMPVGVIRLASPSGEALPPFVGWPKSLREAVEGPTFLLPGGYEFDGRVISNLDEQSVREAARKIRQQGVDNIAITSVFAPIKSDMERQAASIVLEEHPKASLTLSSSIGRIGFLERENACIMNATLAAIARQVMQSFRDALTALNIEAPLFVSQNDGTLMSSGFAEQLPILTLGSGPTNSIRGAAFLTGYKDAIVIDIGGTTSDIGVLISGFPRESSSAVDIGGVRTNFRMPDILSLGLGGGSRVHLRPALYCSEILSQDDLVIGPDSVGYKLLTESYLFGGDFLTMSDVAVISGLGDFGNPESVPPMSDAVKSAVMARARKVIEVGIDRMKTKVGDVPVIIVGGGGFLLGEKPRGASVLVRPNHASVANAIGAAIGQVSGEIDRVFSYANVSRPAALEEIRDDVRSMAVSAGAAPDSVEVVDVEEVALNYLPGNAVRVRARAVGDLIFP